MFHRILYPIFAKFANLNVQQIVIVKKKHKIVTYANQHKTIQLCKSVRTT